MPRLLSIVLPLIAAAHAHVHFEARHLHPVDITPDGARVLAVNAPGGFLSVFAPTAAGPVLLDEIPVGLEPVTVRARTATEAWVVNEVSDSISVVDLTRRVVVCTLPVPDEPADVVFHGDLAFVSCGRANRIAVFDTTTLAEVASIPLQGNFVRALSLSPDGRTLRAAFLLSGNNTTVLHFRNAPPQPAPAAPPLPPPPRTALIVPDSHPEIPYDVLDHDVAEIDTATLRVTGYRGGIGTNLFALAHSPDGTLWAAASEARNLIRFEPRLNGIFAESRIARIGTDTPLIYDLNPAASAPVVPESDRALALSQPMALSPSDHGMWIAAFGSDRVAEMNEAGQVIRRIDLRKPGTETLVRGPRGIVRHDDRLYVLNKLSSTLSVIDEAAGKVISEVALAALDPLPADQRSGRGFFFDARRSGNGTVSCGSCHFDADVDGIAWDLGDPEAELIPLITRHVSIGDPTPREVAAHPMKGPMVTQSLRGIGGGAPFHWRGDKERIQDFNPTFAKLQAGEMLAESEMDQVAAYLEAIADHPNPNREADDTLKPEVAGGDPSRGRLLFHRAQTCSKCHSGPLGTNHVIDEHTSVLTTQPVKNTKLSHVYRKLGFTPDQPTSRLGFGFTHDGSGHDLPRGHEYDQDTFAHTTDAEADVFAYVLSASTGTAPAVGRSVTIRPAGPDDPEMLHLLAGQAAAGSCELVLRGLLGGETASFRYIAGNATWQSADGRSISLADLQVAMSDDDVLTASAVPPGDGDRHSMDRDRDGIPDLSPPLPTLRADPRAGRLFWQPAPGWRPEHSPDLRQWQPWNGPVEASHDERSAPLPPGPFYRLRRTW